MRTNYIKERIDITQKNSKCWLYGSTEVQDKVWLGGEGDPTGIVQEIKIPQY